MKDLIYSKGIDIQKVTARSVKIQLKMRRHRFKWARIDFQLSSLDNVLLVVFVSTSVSYLSINVDVGWRKGYF